MNFIIGLVIGFVIGWFIADIGKMFNSNNKTKSWSNTIVSNSTVTNSAVSSSNIAGLIDNTLNT